MLSFPLPKSRSAIETTPESAINIAKYPLRETFSLRKILPKRADHTGWVATITRTVKMKCKKERSNSHLWKNRRIRLYL